MTIFQTIEVKRDDLSTTRVVEQEHAPVAEGVARLRIERFAITANNVTYGVVGDRIGYWKFFPASGESEGWGVIPVWGVAEVVESGVADLPVGERIYGYFPMASHLDIVPAKVKPARLFDGAAHRAELPPVYNRYVRLAAEPGYDRAMDDVRMVLWPLYATSFCLYDFLVANEWFGAEQTIIPSASSKTAIGAAYAIRTDAAARKIVGVTSPRNLEAVRALGLYDEVVLYDDIEARIAAQTPSVIIDMSGSGAVLGRLHKHLGDKMRFTSNVGLTHYDEMGAGPDFIRERSAMFFAPGHIQKRGAKWGPGVFDAKAMAFFFDAAKRSMEWLKIRNGAGGDAIIAAWREVLRGETPPDASWAVGF